MIKFVCGPKGSGKTKRLIKMANNDVKEANGDIVFIDADNSLMLNLNHGIRYINAMEYNIDNIDTFRGFLYGIIAEDYDIEKIYIDGMCEMLNINVEEFKDFIQRKIDKFNIAFVIGVDSDKVEIPDELKNLVI